MAVLARVPHATGLTVRETAAVLTWALGSLYLTVSRGRVKDGDCQL